MEIKKEQVKEDKGSGGLIKKVLLGGVLAGIALTGISCEEGYYNNPSPTYQPRGIIILPYGYYPEP